MNVVNETLNVNSEAIDTLKYNEQNENLLVQFTSGNKYIYRNVPRNKFLSWKYFDSFGKFFNSNIRNNYKFTKI